MKTAIIYARNKAENDTPLEYQIALCKLFAKINSFKIIQVYTDDSASGISKGRTAFRKLMNDVQNPEWNSILILDPSRISQNPLRYFKYQQKINMAGKRIISIIEQKEESSNEVRCFLR